MRKLLPLSYLLILLSIISCKQNTVLEDATYFGGEIINPKKDFVLLYKGDILIDSIALDKEHRFLYKFKNFTPGLYHFNHEEYQYVFIEPKDSIIFRLNTIDFDESLTFSGKGADKNNFIINTFLANERHEVKARKSFKLPARTFSKRVDAELNQRLRMLDMYQERYEFSDEFMNVANAHIKYHFHTLKERYPMYNKAQADSINTVDFYAFRENIDFNTSNLDSFYPFYEYMYSYVDNLSSQQLKKEQKKETFYTFYSTKIKIIDSLVQLETLKNKLLKNTALQYLSKSECKIHANDFLAEFNQYNTNSENKKHIAKLVNYIERLSKGNSLPEFEIVNTENKAFNIKQVVNKPTVIYFWTTKNPRHLKYVHKKVAHYAQNSKYNYIGISLDRDKEKWMSISKKINTPDEYLLVNPKTVTEELLIQNISKIYVLDKNAKILSTDLNIFDANFKEKLNTLH